MKRILRRAVLAILLLLAALYPLYLAVGNWYLQEGELQKLLNRRPERMSIVWDSAWTSWPGIVHVEGFRIRSQSRVFQWWLAVDRGTVDFDMLSLRNRELLIGGVNGRGASFRLRRRLDAPPRSTLARPDLYPPIPGFENPPDPVPEEIYPRPPRRRKPWHVRISGVQLDDVREVWIEEYRFAGRARVDGGFDARVRERVEVEPTRLEILDGGLALGAGERERPILTKMRGRVYGKVEPYPPQRFKGKEVFRFASGRANVDSRVESLEFLDLLFRQTRWVDVRLGSGPMKADIRLRRGRFLAGSELEARPESIVMDFLDYRAEGPGSARWTVAPAGDDLEGKLALAFGRFTLRRDGYKVSHVRGSGLRIDAVSEEPRIGGLFKPRRVAIDMPKAEVPDLTFYNAYLPADVGMALTAGSGVMSGHFRAAAPDWRGSGELRLTARGIGARFEDRRLRGNLKVHSRLRRIDLGDRRFDLSGSDVELTDVVSLSATPMEGGSWWARAHLDQAVISPGAPVFLRAKVESTLSDPRPVFDFLAPESRSRMVRWVDRLLDVQGVGAVAEIEVGDGFVDIDDLAIAGGDAQVLGRLRLGGQERRGILYASLGKLDVGVELEGTKRDWKILKPKQWFESYPPFE